MNPKYYFPLLVPVLLFSIGIESLAQSPDFVWAKSMGGTNQDVGISITTDAAGNLYSIGVFSGTADFDPNVSGIYNLISAGQTDIFITKMDANGNFIWAKRIGGSDEDHGNSIAIDSAGNVYTTGWVFGTVDFDPGPNAYNLSVAGYTQFISKLDSAGNFIWAKVIGGASSTSTQGEWITIGSTGNIYTSGLFLGTVDFDPDSSAIYNLSSPTNGNCFISKFNSSGHFVWTKAILGTSANAGFFITSDANENLYTTGYFYDTTDFDPGPGTYNLTSAGGSDFFVLKSDSAGNLVWAKNMGGPTNEVGNSITIGTSGDVYSTGYFSGTADFDPDSSGIYYLTSAGLNDVFISKLDSSGNFIWARQVGGAANDYGQSITLDAFQNVYSIGSFVGTVDFDPDLSANFNLISQGDRDVFISRLNKSGHFEFAKAMGGPNEDFGQGIVHNTDGFIFVIGGYTSPTVLFNPVLLTNTSSNGSINDIFVARLDTLTITTINDPETNDHNLKLFPNPASGLFTIDIRNFNKKSTVTILDMAGNIIYEITVTDTRKIEINTRDFAGGVYFLKVKTDDFAKTHKLIISK